MRVWIAGDGSHRTEYETLARELDVLSATTFLGFRPDVPDLMTAADVAAIASRSEGLGTAALEALAMGLPAVAANIGGLPDVVIHEQTGELVPPESPDSLARALARLLRAPQLRRDYAQRGRQLVAEHFTESALARKTIHFYRQLRSQRP